MRERNEHQNVHWALARQHQRQCCHRLLLFAHFTLTCVAISKEAIGLTLPSSAAAYCKLFCNALVNSALDEVSATLQRKPTLTEYSSVIFTLSEGIRCY